MTPDTVMALVREGGSSSVNWLQILIQTLLVGIIAEILRRIFQKKLEFLKNEFTIIQTTFSKNYSVVTDYYSTFFKYYRLCQSVAYADFINSPDGPRRTTQKIFWENVDSCVKQLSEFEARIKLIFPERIVQIYEQSISAFNDFRDLVKLYNRLSDKPRKDLDDKFRQIHKIKEELETQLRKYLRTEQLYPK